MKKRIMFLILFVLLLAFVSPAPAEDAQLLADLPGRWIYEEVILGADGTEADGEGYVEFGSDGSVFLYMKAGKTEYTYSGSWTFELVPNAMDHMTFVFTQTDNPLYAGQDYRVECTYDVYSEAWVENDTLITCMIFAGTGSDGQTPVEDLSSFNEPCLKKEQGPNMKVVNCKSYVSLREERSTKSARLAKVPLGAKVLVLPQNEEGSEFLWCTYHDEYGYILSEYLAPVK